MYVDVKNIDNNDNNTWSTIYESMYAPYFGVVKLFPKSFLGNCKNNPSEP